MPRVSLRPAVVAPLLLAAACSSVGPARESFVEMPDHARLHCRTVGAGDPTVVVLGEGWLSPDLDRLARDRTLVYYDLRNRGRSGRAGSVSLDKDLRDLGQLLETLQLEHVTLIGWDYSAALAALYAADHPHQVRALVLISPLPPRKLPYQDAYDRAYAENVDTDAFQRLREMERGEEQVDAREWAEAYKRTVLSGWVLDTRSLERMKATPLVDQNLDPEPLNRQYKALLTSLGSWDWSDPIARIDCPTLVISGAQDPVPAESDAEWVRTLRQGRGVAVPESAHMPWLERPNDFFAAVDAFLPGGN